MKKQVFDFVLHLICIIFVGINLIRVMIEIS